MDNQEFKELENEQELREIVNPVFNTAKSCIQLNAAAGDEDSIKLLDALGFDSFGSQISSKPVPKVVLNQIKKLFPAYMAQVEGRFQTMNGLIESRPDRQIVDLPCGYTSRGIRMARLGRVYTGLDLPAVIDELTPAVASILGEADGVSYHKADATNYASLEAALPESSAKLLVTTEGLLMYFTQSELDELFSNIHRLLEKFGGSWVISDRAYFLHDQEIAAAALNRNPILMTMYNAITNRAAASTADVKFNDNVCFDPDDEKVRNYIHSMGFDLREVCMGDYLPERLGSMEDLQKADGAVRDAFRAMFFWELTVREQAGRQEFHSSEEKGFSVDAVLEDGILKLALTGRVDTLTSPELLKVYQAAAETGTIRGIEIDMGGLEYISSAGLRVLLIMYKALDRKDQFCLKNTNEAVQDILATTGFDSAFGQESQWS